MAWLGGRGRQPQELEELAHAAMDPKRRAVAPFLKAIAPDVLRVARQVLGREHPDVEDVVQEALVGTLHALPRFRGECGARHFVRRIALLTALNARRRLQLRQQIAPREPDANTEAIAGYEPSPAENLEREHRRNVFLALLDELPAPQAEAIAMHCVLGYSVAETAAASGVPLNTVRGRLVAAKSALRRRIELDATLDDSLRGAL